jgi:hypothetical protein
MAVIPGKVWFREDEKNLYLVCIDLDNQKAIDEIIIIFGVKNLQELSKIVIVEQHKDDLTRAHIYFYSTHIFKKKSSDASKYKIEIENNDIPAIEVKGLGAHGIAFCSNSKHKNGCRYELLESIVPQTFGKEIEDKLFDIYKKYNLHIGKNGKMPINDLLEDDFVVDEGHNRHEALLRIIESLIQRNKKTMNIAKIKQLAFNWNQKHCRPPLNEKEFEKQWRDAKKFLEKRNNEKTDFLSKNDNTLFKIVEHGLTSQGYYIDLQEEEIRYGYITINGLIPKKSIIDIYPQKVVNYKNPLFPKLTQIEIEFSNGLKVGPLNNVVDVINVLECKGHILNKVKAPDALNSIISVLTEKGLVETIDDVTTPGYYMFNNVILSKEVTQSLILEKEKILKCCQYLNHLAEYGWMDKRIFPTVIKWAMVSPFSFILKYNKSDSWLPWLQLYGLGQTGKTTLGRIILNIWNLEVQNYSIGFNHIDSVARFGNIISRDTYPKLVNEIGALSTNYFGKYLAIVEMIKHSVESMTVRGKYMVNAVNNNYQEIPALSAMIFTSNHQPITDSGYNRRMLPIHFSEIEKKDEQQQLSFKKLFEENKIFLKTLGDFTSQYLVQDPTKLLQIPWNELAKEILQKFYQFAGVETPHWIEYFVEQRDAVDESSEKTFFGLRGILVNKINEACSKYAKICAIDEYEQIGFSMGSKLKFCLKNNLIPYLHKVDGFNIALTVDIMNDIKQFNIENITSLADLGLILGFDYVNKRFNGKKMRFLEGSIGNLTTFLESDIK